MTESKTLKELGEEYENAAQSIKEMISKKRAQLRSLKDSLCSNEAYVLKSELKMLYNQRRELSEIAEYLKTYYEPHEGRHELFLY